MINKKRGFLKKENRLGCLLSRDIDQRHKKDIAHLNRKGKLDKKTVGCLS